MAARLEGEPERSSTASSMLYKGKAQQLVHNGFLAPSWPSHRLKELHARLTKALCSFRAPSSFHLPSQPITHTKETFRPLLLSRLFFLFLDDESNFFQSHDPTSGATCYEQLAFSHTQSD